LYRLRRRRRVFRTPRGSTTRGWGSVRKKNPAALRQRPRVWNVLRVLLLSDAIRSYSACRLCSELFFSDFRRATDGCSWIENGGERCKHPPDFRIETYIETPGDWCARPVAVTTAITHRPSVKPSESGKTPYDNTSRRV